MHKSLVSMCELGRREVWPEEMPSFGEAFQAARPWRVIRTRRSKRCILHSEPGPERWLRPTAPAPEPAPVRTDSHAERPPEPKVGPKPTPPLFWLL